MSDTYMPRTDAELADWALNFEVIVTADPAPYGLVPPQMVVFATKRSAFYTAWQTSIAPTSRTPVAIVAKRLARENLVADARELVRIIEACPTVTDEMRRSINITIRKGPAPVPAPTEAPRIDLERTSGHTVTFRLHATGDRRGRPVGTMGANIYGFVGSSAPAREEDWQLMTNTNRTRVELSFDESLTPGTTVWISARWYNQRTQTGPAAAAVTTNLPGSGGVGQVQEMKIAA